MATILANISIKDNSSWNTYLNLIYPVGSIYIAYTSTSPASRFGGTWSQITSKFLYCTTSTGTGGSNTHTLTVSQIPKHTHKTEWPTWVGTSGPDGRGFAYTGTTSYLNTLSAGGGESHNNMPAYQGVYAWRRTA